MTEKFTGTVESFEDCTWFVVLLPEKTSQAYKPFANNFGFIPITLTVGKSTWSTSLLPYNRDKHFIALPKKIRQANNIQLGDKISIEFKIREGK